MDLYIRSHSDYRRGTQIFVSDFEDLKKEYNDKMNNKSGSESGSESYDESDSESVNESDIDNYIQNDEDILDIVMIDDIPMIDRYNIYLIYGCIYEIYHVIVTDDLQYAKTILQQLFSDINECKPFIVTGMTCAYKETGHYPDPLPPLLINEKPLIDETIKQMIKEKGTDYCVAVIIKNKQLVDYQQILPLF